MDIKSILKKELIGWEKLWVTWLIFSVLIILGTSIYQGDSWIGIIASLSGVICVILCGMGRVSHFFFGTINILLYAYIAWKAGYYGDVMLNLIYYFPTNIIGWIAWRKHVNNDTNAIYKKRMDWKQHVALITISIVSIVGYGFFLKMLGGNLPVIDSISTVFSIMAQILMIKRFVEQWIIWIIVDAASVVMWLVAIPTEGASIAVLLMWSVFLANAIIMFIKWSRESKRQPESKHL